VNGNDETECEYQGLPQNVEGHCLHCLPWTFELAFSWTFVSFVL
jgi:hypothetical protein